MADGVDYKQSIGQKIFDASKPKPLYNSGAKFIDTSNAKIVIPFENKYFEQKVYDSSFGPQVYEDKSLIGPTAQIKYIDPKPVQFEGSFAPKYYEHKTVINPGVKYVNPVEYKYFEPKLYQYESTFGPKFYEPKTIFNSGIKYINPFETKYFEPKVTHYSAYEPKFYEQKIIENPSIQVIKPIEHSLSAKLDEKKTVVNPNVKIIQPIDSSTTLIDPNTGKQIGSSFAPYYYQQKTVISPDIKLINPIDHKIIDNSWTVKIDDQKSSILRPDIKIIEPTIGTKIIEPSQQKFVNYFGSKIINPFDDKIYGSGQTYQNYYLVGDPSQTVAWLTIPRAHTVNQGNIIVKNPHIIDDKKIIIEEKSPSIIISKPQEVIPIQTYSDLLYRNPESILPSIIYRK